MTPETGRIDDVVNRVQSGQLRRLFISNLRVCPVGSLGDLASSVRKAQTVLGGHRDDPGVLEEEVEPLGEGGFGIVTGACHTMLPGKFAIKKMKQVKGSQSVCRVHDRNSWGDKKVVDTSRYSRTE